MTALLTQWVVDPVGLGLPAVAVTGYLWLQHRVTGWRYWRTTVWVAGWAVFAWAASGGPAAGRAHASSTGALGVAVATAVVPLLLAVADPVGLVERAHGRRLEWLRSRPVRMAMFPLVASTMAAVLQFVAFTGAWYPAARTSTLAWDLLILAGLGSGLLVNLPLLTEDLLPSWCGGGLKTLFAAVDGLIDAVPGLVVAFGVDWNTGMTLLATAEAVGVPMICAVMMTWVRDDERQGREVDALLDARAQERIALHRQQGETFDDIVADNGLPLDGDRPWWETDPRLADRYRSY